MLIFLWIMFILLNVAAAIGIPIYLVHRYENNVRGRTSWWQHRRRQMQEWAAEDYPVQLPAHVQRLLDELRALLERVPPWSSEERTALDHKAHRP